MSKGYTLIEFIVVLGLLALAVGSALVFLTSVLRGSNQANISAEVKQNGQAVLDSLERQIRGAKTATIIDSASLPVGVSSGIVLTNNNGSNLYIACFDPTASDNGAIKTATQLVGQGVPSEGLYRTLTNPDKVSGININPCSISVTASSSVSGAVVAIDFTAGRAISAPTRVDFDASAKFNTTISLRNY